MAEKLGEAVLDLKTNDAAFMAGVNKAEAAANGLGKTLDACSGSSAKLAAEITEAANSGNRGAQAWLAAGTAIQKLAAAQVEADVEIKNAKAALDAGTISLEQYKRQVLETQAALAIYEDEHRKAQVELRKSIAANREVTTATGAQRQGLIQLTQQLGDATTMYSLGMRPQQIFATQIGQTASAVQLLAGESSKFAQFLGGTWGIAVTGAVMVLGPLIGALFDTGKAAATAKDKVDSLKQALADLKSKPAETLGRLNLDVATAEARLRQLEASPIPTGSGEAGRASAAAAADARDRAIEQARDDLQRARTAFGVAQDLANKTGLLNPPSPGSTKKGGGTSRATTSSAADGVIAFQRDMSNAIRDELQAQLALATNASDRLEIQKQLLENDRSARIAEIEASKTLTEAQKAIRKGYVNRLYGQPGKVGPNGEIITEGKPGLLAQRANRDFEAEQTRLANDLLQRQAQSAQAWAQVSLSSTERARLEARALELQQQIETNLLEQQIATGQVADAEKARAELRSQQEAARTGLAQRNAGPIDQYVTQLEANKHDSGRRVEALMVQELDYVHQSITDTISSRLGVKDPLLKGLIDMFLEDVLIRPLAEALQNARKGSGGGGGIFGSLFGSIFGGGGGGSLAGLVDSASATISDPAFAGLFADGGLIPNGAWGIVGDAGPEPIRATVGGIEVRPNSSLRGMGSGTGPGVLKVEISGARGNAEIEQMVSSGVAQGLAAYDARVAGRVQDYNNRRGNG